VANKAERGRKHQFRSLYKLLRKATMVHMPPSENLLRNNPEKPEQQEKPNWVRRFSLVAAEMIFVTWVLPQIGLPLWLGVVGVVVALIGLAWPTSGGTWKKVGIAVVFSAYIIVAAAVIARPYWAPTKPATPTVKEEVRNYGETFVLPGGGYGVIRTPDTPPAPKSLTNFDEIPIDDLRLEDLFFHDFATETNTSKDYGGWLLRRNSNGQNIHIMYFVVVKMDSNSKFLQFFVPFTDDAYTLIEDIANTHYKRALDNKNQAIFRGRAQTGDSTLNDSRNAVFTGRVFVYSEADLNAEDLGKLTALYKERGLLLQFRSATYLETQQALYKLTRR
jgi:hypothetical protein